MQPSAAMVHADYSERNTMHSPLAVAVMALLRERPMHPYELHQLLHDRHLDELIKVRAGSLYHTVDRLARDGFIEAVATEREGNRPERTTYRVTESGDQAVRAWVRDRLARPQREYPTYPYALHEAHNLEPDEVVAALVERCDRLTNDLSRLESDLARRDPEAVYRIGADRSTHLLRSELEWTRDLIGRIERKDFPWHPWT
jgi:DNA-binding PadR family transcriptional regulator